MGIIKINEDLLAARVRTGGEFLGAKSGFSADMLADILTDCGSNIKSFYHGANKAYHSGEAPLAYLLDNYYQHAIKFNGCDRSIMQLLNGTIAILFFESQLSTGGHWIDIWNGHGLSFTSDSLDIVGAKRVWVWGMGMAATQAKAKSKHHSHGHKKHHAIQIF